MKRLTLALVLVTICFSVRAQLIWDGDASNGTSIFKLFGQGNVEPPSTLTAVDDPQRGRIWRYHKPSGSNRCENHGIRVNGSGYTFQNGQTYYLGWSTKLTNNSDNNAIFQWKSYDNHIQNFPVVLKLINGRLSVLQRQPGPVETIIWSAPFSANTWYHVVLGLHLSDATRGGWVEFYFNGVQQTFNNGAQRYACRTFDSHNCPKWGIYGRSDLTITNFVDDLKVGRTYNDVRMPGAPTAPSAPSGLTATAVSSSQINLSWNDNSNNETQFRIERSTNAGGTWSFLANAGTNAMSYSNTGLSASTTYHYRVRAENAAGNSAFSNTANATTEPSTTLPNVALNKSVTASSSDTNIPANAVDGSTTTRWSASPFPQWLEVDLGAVYDISRTEVISYEDRAYRFVIDTKTTATGSYARVVDRSASTTPGSIASPITDTFGPVNARYVRITVSGASGYTGVWASLIEFRVFGVPVTTTPSDIYLEAESGTIVAPMQVFLGSTAFGGQYIAVAAGNNSQAAPPAGRATYTFSVPTAGTYKVWGRVVAPTTGDDSFWVRMDGGTWINWNEIALGVAWHWDEVHDASNANTVVNFNLAAGSHTLDVAYREDGTQLDRILITSNPTLNPNTSAAAEARNATPEIQTVSEQEEINLSENLILSTHPNPVYEQFTLTYKVKERGKVRVTMHSVSTNWSTTIVDESKEAGVHIATVDASALSKGLYVIKAVIKDKVTTTKIVKK